MADNVTLSPGAGGAVVATDDDGVAQHQYVKVEFGADNTQTKVTSAVGLPTDPLDRAARDGGKIDIAMGQAAHDAAGAAIDPVAIGGYASAAAPTNVSLDTDIVRAWHLLNGAYAVNVTAAGALIAGDATNGLDVDVTRLPALVAGSANIGDVDVLTVPAPLSTTGGGTEATALRVTIASDSTGVVSIDDNGGAITVDGTVTANIGTSGSLNLEATQANVLTAVQLLDDTVQVLGTDTYTEATSKGITLGAVRRDADTTLVNTTNEFSPLQVDANGRLKVEAFSGETLPVSGTVTANIGTSGSLNLETTQTSVLTAVQLIDDSVATLGTTTYSEATTKGLTIGAVRRDAATSPVGTDNEIGPLTMTALGALKTSVQPDTAGGLTIFRSLDLDETEEEVKATAGQVYGIWFSNMATTTRFLKFYNADAATVVVGTTTPVITLALPGNTSDDISGMFASANGIAFGTAITVAATTGLADADTGAPSANDVIVNIFFK